MTRAEAARLGCVLVLGMALAFPAALFVAGRGDGDPPPGSSAPSDAPRRDVYSPSIVGDPWFLARQREAAEALERQCRAAGEHCAEAEQLRRWLAEQGAGD